MCKHCGNKILGVGKKYCSSKCQQDFQSASLISAFVNGADGGDINGELKKTLKRYLLDIAGNQCSECKWSKVNPFSGKVTLTIDHIDGDARNNTLANLKVLCYNCHTLTPTFNQLNRGKGTRRITPGTRRIKDN